MVKTRVRNEEELRDKFLNLVEKYIDKKKYCLIRDKQLYGKYLDLYIEDVKKNPYVVFEFKNFLNTSLARQSGKHQLKDYCKLAKVEFGVLTDLKKYYLYKKNKFEAVTFYQLLITLFPEIKGTIVPQNYEIIKKYLKKCKLDKFKLRLQDVKLKNDFLCFSSNYEKKFIKQFPSFSYDDERICRYVPLDTLFQIIKNKKIRLNGIVGMNDSTEADFVEKILYGKKLDNIESQKKANSIYIMSCSSGNNIDKLTQWRLYGDDTKGACLVFEINENNKTSSRGFKLGKVQYCKYKSDSLEEKNNPSEILSNIKDFIESVYDKTLLPFVFHSFHEWAHFYKPEDYEIEDEIRLLYVNNGSITKKWFVSNKINVINSYIEIPLAKRDFPLKLTEIYLGPKCPERDENKKQLKVMLNEINRDDVDVILSDIECYR